MDFPEIVQHLENLKLFPNKMGDFAINGECVVYGDDRYSGSEYDVMGVLEDFFGIVEIVDKSYINEYNNPWCVYGFMDHDVYLKYTGQSGYNMTWNKPREVRPYEKTIIEYK